MLHLKSLSVGTAQMIGEVGMALVNCPECQKEVSDTVSQCIHCGYQLVTARSVPHQNTTPPAGTQLSNQVWLLLIGLLLVVGWVVWAQSRDYTYRKTVHEMLDVIESDMSGAIGQYIEVEQIRSDAEANGEQFYPVLEEFNKRTSTQSQRQALIDNTRIIEQRFADLGVPMTYSKSHERLAMLVQMYANFVRKACSDSNDGYDLQVRFSAESVVDLIQEIRDAIPPVASSS